MYPIRIEMEGAIERIEALERNGHSAEALVTSVFTLEKLIRRSMRVAIIARGFTSKQADTIIGRKGFDQLKEIWPVFDRQHRRLPELVSQKTWQFVKDAVSMRNDFAHGKYAHSLKLCRERSEQILAVIRELHSSVSTDFGIDPWSRIKGRRKPLLQWHDV